MLRDRGLLDSACAAPRATFDGRLLHPSLFKIAAAYAYHIAGNHPFVDGNKRAGMQAALFFLQLNGIAIDAPKTKIIDEALALAQGQLTISVLADIFRTHARPES